MIGKWARGTIRCVGSLDGVGRRNEQFAHIIQSTFERSKGVLRVERTENAL